jgi:hypothetical protein
MTATASERSMRKMLTRAAPIVARLPAGAPVMVEVGVFTGLMAGYLLQRRPDLQWYGVDNWLPAKEQPAAYRRTEDMHANASAEQQAQWRAQAFRTTESFGRRARIIERGSVEAATEFPDASADLVFVDADHSYDGCAADLRAWWPKVKPGGYLGGHDYGNPDPRFLYGVDPAVDEFAIEVGLPLEADAGHTYFFRKPSP